MLRMRWNAPTRMVSDWGSITPFVTNQLTGRNDVLSAAAKGATLLLASS
jgi:hypothetical protein